SFFKKVGEHTRVVPWTEDRTVVSQWLREGYIVVVRTSLTGHSGHGIILLEQVPDINIPTAPLYTKYIKKDSEFRLHFLGGELIDTQKKIRDPDKEPTTWKVRSHDNGFMFVRTGFEIPEDVINQARLAYEHSGLDFGAVDVVYNRKQASAY